MSGNAAGETDEPSGLLRAIRAEGAHRERARINDDLVRMLEASGAKDYRRRALLRAALDVVPLFDLGATPYEHETGTTAGHGLIDTVDVGWTDDEPEEPDENPDAVWPVRIMVFDGADSATASAYLTVAAAEDLIEGLQVAVREATAAQQRRRETTGDA